MLRAQYDINSRRDRKSKSSEAIVFYDGLHDRDSDSEMGPEEYAAFLDRSYTRETTHSVEPASSSDTEELSSSSDDDNEVNQMAAAMVATEIAKISTTAFETAIAERKAAEHASLATYLLSNLEVCKIDSDTNGDSKEAEIIRLCLRRNALIKLFPVFSRQIRALAYEGGLFTMKDSSGYDPTMNSFFRHDEKLADAQLPAEIAEFAQRMREFAQKHCVDVTASNRQTM